MTACYVHSKKTGKRCSLKRGHDPRHIFNQSCICGIAFCIGRNKRIIRDIGKQMEVA